MYLELNLIGLSTYDIDLTTLIGLEVRQISKSLNGN